MASTHDENLRAAGASDCEKGEYCSRPAGHVGFCNKARAPGGPPPSHKPKRKADRSPLSVAGPTARKPQARSLEARLDSLFGSIGSMVYVFDQICGGAIVEQSGELAGALDSLAKENPKVRQTLERALTGGAWSGVLLAAAPIGMAVAQHHILPIFGRRMPPQAIPAVRQEQDTTHRQAGDSQAAVDEASWNAAFAHRDPSEVFG